MTNLSEFHSYLLANDSDHHNLSLQLCNDLLSIDEHRSNADRSKLKAEDDPQDILDNHCSRVWADDNCEFLFAKPTKNNIQSKSRLVRHPASSLSFTRNMRNFDNSMTSCDANEWAKRDSSNRQNVCSAMANLSSTNCENALINQHNYRTKSHQRGIDAKQRINPPFHSYRKNHDYYLITSLDSGVVTTNGGLFDHDSETNYYDDDNSVLDTASLQALSSSTTELALLNGEVTAKLVNQMIRCYRTDHQRQFNLLSSLPVRRHSSHNDSEANHNLPNCESKYENQWTKPNLKGLDNSKVHDFGHLNKMYLNKIENSIINNSDNNRTSSGPMRNKAILNASDTSSTFDSGISSTYDHLPSGKSGASNRDNRSR